MNFFFVKIRALIQPRFRLPIEGIIPPKIPAFFCIIFMIKSFIDNRLSNFQKIHQNVHESCCISF